MRPNLPSYLIDRSNSANFLTESPFKQFRYAVDKVWHKSTHLLQPVQRLAIIPLKYNYSTFFLINLYCSQQQQKKWKTILPLTCHNIHFCNTQFLAYRFYYHYSSLHLTSTPFKGMSKTPSPYKYDLIKHFKVRTPANPRPQPPQKQCQFHKSLMAFIYFATNFNHDFGSKTLI